MRAICGHGLVVKVCALGSGGAGVAGIFGGEGSKIVRAPFVCSWMAVDCSGSGGAGIGFAERGVVFVGERSMYLVISSGTEAGVTFSMIRKEGRRRTVVGWVEGSEVLESEWVCGRGMLEAESISLYRSVNNLFEDI